MQSVTNRSELTNSSVDENIFLAGIREWCLGLIDDAQERENWHRTCVERESITESLGVDQDALAATWLYSSLESQYSSLSRIQRKFGNELSNLVRGIKRMDWITHQSNDNAAESSDNFRKMLIAMIDDVRVVLVRLSCQLQQLRVAKNIMSEEEQTLLGKQTLDIYAPLANRLGIWQLKWELEDYSFRYLYPDVYMGLARRLSEKRIDREQYIENFTSSVKDILDQAGIGASVVGRPKHLYSIYKKMQKKGLEFDRIHDIRAVRILVGNVAECYASLGLVHTRFSPVPGEFDDYIATPKENGYRSIHTAVVGEGGRIVEVQIRTHEMHDENELGVAAHWRYKETTRQDSSVDSKILWLRQLLEWKDEVGETDADLEQFHNETVEERIYVFSPKGRVVDLPFGSTPLDFAYAIHTDVGHQCRGARVNGRMVNLNYALSTGEQVDILTQRSGTPSRDWLNASSGYVHTHKAKSRIQRWFKEADFDQNVSAGRAALDRELYRLGSVDTGYEKLATQSNYKKVDEFLGAIGSGDLKLSHAVSSIRPAIETRKRKTRPSPSLPVNKGMEVQGVGNLLTHFAVCCNPLPGDEIVGYITQGKGVAIHRADCGNILRLEVERVERLVQVDWGGAVDNGFEVEVEIFAIDRQGLLHDVSQVLTDIGVNVLATSTQSDTDEHSAYMRFRLQINDVRQLSHVLTKISMVPNVTDVRRITH